MDYTDFIMNKGNQDSFINSFEKDWQQRISKFPEPFNSNYQLIKGSRMRPLLVAWGYFANVNSLNKLVIPRTLYDLCYSVELLHKSSIIIDDLIDNDTQRNGKDTFHHQFGNYEAILFSLFLIGTSFKTVSMLEDSDIQNDLADTLIQMSTGALSEISLQTENIFDLRKIKKIVNQQTSSLIKSSYFLGYLHSQKNNVNIGEINNSIKKIGMMCGFLFQMLNDLEPFSSIRKNQKHKGKVNFDIYNSRKNYVVSFLYGYANRKDQATLISLLQMDNKEKSQEILFNLLYKYKIEDKILKKSDKIQNELIFEINNLGNWIQNQYISEFSMFVNLMIDTSRHKLTK